MKRVLISLFIIALLSFIGFQYLSKPSYTCEQIVEPFIPAKEFYSVDSVVKLTIGQHLLMIKGPENIQKAIRGYRLDELYEEEASSLQVEIASQLKVKQLPESNKISIQVGAESEKREQQILYAIVHSYAELLEEKKDLQAEQLIKRFKTKREHQKRNVSTAKHKLSSLATELGIKFIDPNTRVRSYETTELDIEDKLTPEQMTRYAIEVDRYLAELKSLKSIQMDEFDRTISEGSGDALMLHNYELNKAVASFMDQRKSSTHTKESTSQKKKK